MKNFLRTTNIVLFLTAVIVLLAACSEKSSVSEVPTPTSEVPVTSTDTPAPTPTATATPEPTSTPSPTFTPTATPVLTTDTASLKEARSAVWEEYRTSQLESDILKEETEGKTPTFSKNTKNAFKRYLANAEVTESAMKFGDVKMRYITVTVGEKPEGGYPLYIALHGGGGAPASVNNEQWEMMSYYYSMDLDCGVYVATRGVRDTWDTHFNPESYPLYDRLIQYMILTKDVDPNKVYIMGFSAGGDGVYAITPRMADRFAGANMSSGHPNGVNLTNVRNVPFELQAGEYDTAYDRHKVTAEYDAYLTELEAKYGGYVHRTLIHYEAGHNYNDYDSYPIPVMDDVQAWLSSGDRSNTAVDSYPPHWLSGFTRDPLPQTVVWDLSTRADRRETESFYYLSAPYSTNSGLIKAAYDKAENRVEITTEGVNGTYSILLNEDMVDFSKPVTIVLNGKETVKDIAPDFGILLQTTAERGDPNYQFEAKVSFE